MLCLRLARRGARSRSEQRTLTCGRVAEKGHLMSAADRTAGQLVVDALVAAGVRHCFGVPGESFLGVLDALRDSPINVISTRHEGGGAFMASGYSRASG